MAEEETYQRVLIREIEIEGFGKVIVGFGVEFPERVGIGMNIEIGRERLRQLEEAIKQYYDGHGRNLEVKRITSKSLPATCEISHAISEYLDLSKEEI
jgi:hypothetical protein